MNSKNNTKTTILGNERSEGGVLISEMNKLFDKRDWNFKSAVGELTVSTKNATDNRNEALFPDAIVFEDKENLTPAIGWEFKMPDTPINDDELFSNAKDKANRLGTNVIVLWNFQYCHVFYRKDDKGWSRNPNRIYDQYSNILTNRKNVYNNKAIYVKQLEQVLQDLNADYINNLYQVAPIKFNIDNYINTIADTLTPLLANHLLDLHDPILLAKMKNFSLNEKAEFGSDKPLKGVSKEKTAAITYSKNIVIRWMNRIIFSNLIRTKYNIISSLLNTFISENNIDKFKDAYLESHISEKPLIAYEVRPSRCSFRNDGISPCLTAKMGTGGNNVPIVVSQKRKLTERECLKIMGFPENFVIKKNSSHSYKQLGNSVVVPVVSVLAKELIRVLKTI